MDKLNAILAPIVNLLAPIVNSSKLGGWVRSAVGAGFVFLIARYPVLGTLVPQDVQVEIALGIATVVVGYWSTLTKTDSAKLAAVEAMPSVKTITIVPVAASPDVAAVAADPTRPKVTT